MMRATRRESGLSEEIGEDALWEHPRAAVERQSRRRSTNALGNGAHAADLAGVVVYRSIAAE